MNGGARINLEDAWPISDEEGRGLTGYTFTVENKCEDPVNYIIALESLESTKGLEYLNNNYVKLAIDDEIEKRYGSLDTIENVVLENDPETIRETKEVTTATVAGNSINEHTIRIWLSEDAPLTEQNKVFTSRVRITGGQGIEPPIEPTADSCFEIDENGEILGYDESCGESVVIPAKVNGTPVKTIDSNAFKEVTTTYNYDLGIVLENSNPVAGIIYNMDEFDNLKAWADRNGFGSLPFYTEEPVLQDGQKIQYCEDPVDGQMPMCHDTDNLILKTEVSNLLINSLDLSQTIYLEKIENFAFSHIASRQEYLDNESNIETGLTNLVFSKANKNIILGQGVFVGLDVDELTTYTNLVVPVEDVENEDLESGVLDYILPFMASSVNDLNILPSNNSNSLYSAIYPGAISYDTIEECVIYLGIDINRLALGEGITEIPALTFFSMSDLTSINELNLPSSLTSIGDFSFIGAENINNLTLPDSVKYIGDNAFSAAGIQTVKMPSQLETIGDNAFVTNDIREVEFYEGLTTIGGKAFWNNKNLTRVIIPSTIKEIGAEAFLDATGTITMKGRTDLTGLTLGTDWMGSATIVYENLNN